MNVKKGCIAAALAAAFAAGAAQSASADPIGVPWLATGSYFEDWALSGNDCDLGVVGNTDGTAITNVIFTSCSGSNNFPRTSVTPWPITWNGIDTGGVIAMSILRSVPPVGNCLFTGSVPFSYAGNTFGGTFFIDGEVFTAPVGPCAGGSYGIQATLETL
jgi:hypothetical protein